MTNDKTRARRAGLLVAAVALTMLPFGACRKRQTDAGTGAAANLRIGYVLHVLNDFSEVIKRGAEDAAADLGVTVDVQGPAGASSSDAVAIFEGMVQRRLDGLAVVPMPGEVWTVPLARAAKAGVPVATANITSTDPSRAWFGQDERRSGVALATALRRALADAGVTSGKVVVGTCVPGLQVLSRRYDGFVEAMRGADAGGLTVTAPFDVTVPNPTNYATWESLAGANPDAVAMVGLCSMDVPNLAKVKARTKARWVVAGYDLNVESLDAVRAGNAAILVGQHPYLQGYLPVRALVDAARGGKPLPRGWIDVGTEVITKENVDAVYARETDPKRARAHYAQVIRERFASLGELAAPLPAR